MARTLNLGNVIAQINGSRVLNISATQPVVWTQSGYNATISVPNASQVSSGLMSISDKTKLDGIQANSVALGETSSTAYRGDRGKSAYDHSLVTTGNPHQVTKAQVGLGNVPNVTTNNQTPTYITSSTLTPLTSGETLETAMGKISKTTDTVISHIADTTVHITSSERGAWNNKVDKVTGKALSTNDFTDALKDKLDGIETGAEVNEIYAEDHGKTAGAVIVLSREIEDLKKYCEYLKNEIEVIQEDGGRPGIVSGKRGFAYIDDSGTIKQASLSIQVDPSFEGSELYVQCITDYYDPDYASTNPILTSTTLDQYKVDAHGIGSLDGMLFTAPFARSYIFVTTGGYVFDGTTSSANVITSNNSAFGSDGFPVNGVDFKLKYYKARYLDEIPTRSGMNESVMGYYDVLALNGYKAVRTKYASIAAATTGFNNGDTVVIEDNCSLDYLRQSNYWNGNKWIRLTKAPPLFTYKGDYYKETIVPAV